MSAPLTAADGEVLAGLAVAAVAARLAGHPLAGAAPDSPALQGRGASFVTLETGGALRGCIGSLEPVRPLYRDVTRNAVRAMADPRMPPVTAADWAWLDVSVSVLSPPEPLPCPTLDTLLAALRPGLDGLVLSSGRRRATFLPQVWEKLPTPERFVAALLAKGGWPAGGWPPGLFANRYTVIEFHDRAESRRSWNGSRPAGRAGPP
jgi:AmmeMemoRadiSam system protein A